jgi:hypothetical protein
MRSRLADQLLEEQRATEARLTPTERVALALALGRRDLRAYASASGQSLGEAHRALRRAAQCGRTPSKAMQDLDP